MPLDEGIAQLDSEGFQLFVVLVCAFKLVLDEVNYWIP